MQSIKENLKISVVFYALSVVAVALFFVAQQVRGDVSEYMTSLGRLFYYSSCFSHAACLCLVPLLFTSVLCWLKFPKVARRVGIVLLTLLLYFLWLDSNVYALYRFHINGFVMNMVLGPGAGEIFAFSPIVYLKEAMMVLLFALLAWGGWRLAVAIVERRKRCYGKALIITLVVCTLIAHCTHAVGAYKHDYGVVSSARILPHYYPLTAKSLCRSLGIEGGDDMQLTSGTAVQYPLQPLTVAEQDSLRKPNIVLILIDSWNLRSFTQECMPNVSQFASQSVRFDNHFSCSNGTRSAIFGLFFGVPCYYWEDFEAAKIRPLFIEQLLASGYDCRTYPSATLRNPDFANMIFSAVPNLTTDMEGESSFERDERLTEKFLADLPELTKADKPYFAFLFYDLPHSHVLPDDYKPYFEPSWYFADYTTLSNDSDPTPFFNLYRNCCREDDRMIGRVLDSLRSVGALDNTIVIVSGDHGQEYNETHHNYWGHNGNFARWQVGVPLMMHWPGQTEGYEAGRVYTHRTTHYDIVPTLMKELGVENPSSDYSVGRLLADSTSRGDELVGSHLNFAFIGKGDTIFEQLPGGGFQVYAPNMDPLPNYHVTSAQFEGWMKQLNAFYK